MELNNTIFENEELFAASCTELVKSTAEALLLKNAAAAAAESLTGGLISSEIVRVPGSSKWFCEGAVTYTERAKMQRLSVKPETLAAHTAVSHEVAAEMALGELKFSGADIAVSATGLAGPGCDEFGRPAGLVFIGGAARFGVVTKKLLLSGDRLSIRRQAAFAALALLKELADLL